MTMSRIRTGVNNKRMDYYCQSLQSEVNANPQVCTDKSLASTYAFPTPAPSTQSPPDHLANLVGVSTFTESTKSVSSQQSCRPVKSPKVSPAH